MVRQFISRTVQATPSHLQATTAPCRTLHRAPYLLQPVRYTLPCFSRARLDPNNATYRPHHRCLLHRRTVGVLAEKQVLPRAVSVLNRVGPEGAAVPRVGIHGEDDLHGRWRQHRVEISSRCHINVRRRRTSAGTRKLSTIS
jgi:hypothetical protein